MLLVLSEEHKEHLSFLTKVDVEGERVFLVVASCSSDIHNCMQW